MAATLRIIVTVFTRYARREMSALAVNQVGARRRNNERKDFDEIFFTAQRPYHVQRV
jgi:hypothetical protein